MNTTPSLFLMLLWCNVLLFPTYCEAKTIDLEKLRITNQLDHWNDDPKAFRTFDTVQLFELIDGGATEYIENGLERGIFQRLVSQKDSATLELYLELFKTQHAAQTLYGIKKTSMGDSCFQTSIDTRFLCITPVIGGFAVCGSISRFYFELVLTGISDKNQAVTVIKTIFQLYKQKLT